MCGKIDLLRGLCCGFSFRSIEKAKEAAQEKAFLRRPVAGATISRPPTRKGEVTGNTKYYQKNLLFPLAFVNQNS